MRDFSLSTLSQLIFWSRWLQAPLYLGLIVAQGVYVYHFMIELSHLVSDASKIGESEIMLIVLGLIDVVMIANLEPATIRGEESQGMILAASDGDGISVLSPDRDITLGSFVK